jgi:hypothetical protein
MDDHTDSDPTVADLLAWVRDVLPPERESVIRTDVRSSDSRILALLRDTDLLLERLKEREPEAFSRLERAPQGDVLKWLERHPQPDRSPLSDTEREAMKAQDPLIEEWLTRGVSDQVRRRDPRSRDRDVER